MDNDNRLQEVNGILIILVSIILMLSLSSYNADDFSSISSNNPINNMIGPIGAWIAHYLRSAFGLASYIFSFMFLVTGLSILKTGGTKGIIEKIFSLIFITICSTALLALYVLRYPTHAGGFIGISLVNFLIKSMGHIGTSLVVIIFNIIGCILLGIISITATIDYIHSLKIGQKIAEFSKKIKNRNLPLNTISKDLENKGKKIPWIIRKKITIYEIDETGSMAKKALESLKLIEMSENQGKFTEIKSAPIEMIASELKKVNTPIGSKVDPIIFRNENPVEYESMYNYDSNDEITIEASPASIIIQETEQKDLIQNRLDDIKIDYQQEHGDIDNRIISETLSLPCTTRDDLSLDIEKISKLEAEEFSEVDKLAGTETMDRVFEEIEINTEYIIPTAFLNSTIPIDTESWRNEVTKNSKLLVNTLSDFGIESRVMHVNRGPVITLYELQIAPGIKVNKIVSLADDIAMALAAYRVRIVAPIPGKSAIGVEIPNREREMVTLGDILKYQDFHLQSGCLNVALGKDILGKPVILDIKQQPHLLIAGATGSGKSVCVNSIITSLIYNYNPNYVRFILIDPKMVELILYNGLPHLLTPVITEPHLAPMALKWALYEMERRYRLLSYQSSRDILKYNEKIEQEGKDLEQLPYIIIIIDELADLMMVAAKDIEGYITRIAQKARAVGIHLVLATQRPSVDIITGVIKANFPARIAFQVAQKTDSRTIIDQNGAEKLLGKGDMLYQSPTSSYPMRVQGAYISEEEIQKIVTHIGKQMEPRYIDIEQFIFQTEDENKDREEPDDELFVEALKIVEETRKASASYLQRRLSIGYNRAARIIEMMEELGYVGPQQGSKPREIFI